MKQGIVKFSKEFVTETGLKEWVGIELEFDASSESALEAMRRAETIVREYQRPKSYLMHYEASSPSQQAPQRTTEDERIANTLKSIYACTELGGDNGLMSFQKVATLNKETGVAYNIMFKKLSQNAV